MFGLGTGEILLILVIALIVLGPAKLPELAKSLGKGMREFRRATTDFQRQINDDGDDDHRAGGPHRPRPAASDVAKDAPASDGVAESTDKDGTAAAAAPVRPGPPVEVERTRRSELPRVQSPEGAVPRGADPEPKVVDLAKAPATEPERG